MQQHQWAYDGKTDKKTKRDHCGVPEIMGWQLRRGWAGIALANGIWFVALMVAITELGWLLYQMPVWIPVVISSMAIFSWQAKNIQRLKGWTIKRMLGKDYQEPNALKEWITKMKARDDTNEQTRRLPKSL